MKIIVGSTAESSLAKLNEIYADLDSLFFRMTEDMPKESMKSVDWGDVTSKLTSTQSTVRELDSELSSHIASKK